ncbi:MAG TPA: IS200/IS605 family transposase [Pyrinomonadaceae bacterium]|jgi:REP element-mobilizing transposase RayT|nr:IS200/IS605 family transposase [Pyrinomonadaceae bacterium]
MAQTLVSSYFHIVFSTKNRFNFIPPDLEYDLYGYIGGILNNLDSKLIVGNGTPNHVHLLVSLNKNQRIPDVVGNVKRGSTVWLKEKGGMLSKFGWQDGYSAFSVGYKQVEAVKQYITNQKNHHRQTAFEDEMRRFYRNYEVVFDEHYVWD